MIKMTKEKAMETLATRSLPTDFDQWDMADDSGWTVAHEAAYRGHLPAGFNQWKLANEYGWTVAHEAARHKEHLPADFDQWALMSRKLEWIAYDDEDDEIGGEWEDGA